jgi:hypothetical protein
MILRHTSMAFEVNSAQLSDTIICGLPRTPTIMVMASRSVWVKRGSRK